MSGAQPKTFKAAVRRWLESLDKPLTFVVLVFSFAAAYFGAVEWRVRSIVKDPDFVALVARRVSPAMVFDSQGRVLADMGALAFLKGPPEVEAVGPTRESMKITIHPNAALHSEPIVQALDEANVSVTAKRSRGVSWEILIVERRFTISGVAVNGVRVTPPPPSDLAAPRFRLEISPP